jgi:hypothetical protein
VAEGNGRVNRPRGGLRRARMHTGHVGSGC